MLAFILEVSLYWSVFYLVYFLFLRKETFFRFNRYYLLTALFGGLVLPVFSLSWTSQDPVFVAGMELLGPVTQVPAYFKVITADQNPVWHWQDILLLIYWLGVAVFASRLVYGLAQILQMYRRGDKTRYRDYTLIEMPKAHLPFSFFHWVFWPREAEHLRIDRDFILKHELSHVHDRHSLDVLILEILQVFLWCSPLIYLYRRSIRTLHEYLADRSVLQTTHVKIYGHTLLRQSTSGLQVALANHFINSQLKNRITMMIRKPSGWAARFKLLYVLPALLLIALLVAAKSGPQNKDTGLQAGLLLTQDSVAPLYLIHYRSGEEIRTRSIEDKKLDPQAIEKINVFKGEQATSKFGTDGANGVVEIYLKTNFKEPNLPRPAVEEVFKVVEDNPRFPGCTEGSPEERENCGKQKLLQYIYQNIRYPQAARDAGIQGMVVVQFVVEKDGSLSHIETIRDVGGGTGEEGLRIVQKMNDDGLRWDAGKQRGAPVRVEYKLPIRFKLTDQTEASPQVEEIYKGSQLDRPPLLAKCTESGGEPSECTKAQLMEKIYQTITYPKDARAAEWSGVVHVTYYVGVDGKAHFEKLGGDQIPASIQEDVKKVVEGVGPWQPGLLEGKPLNVRQSFTIEYKLETSKVNNRTLPSAPSKASADFVVVGYAQKGDSQEQPQSNIEIKGMDKASDYLMVVYKEEQVVGKFNQKTSDQLPYTPDQIESVNVIKGEKAQSKYNKESVIEIFLKANVVVQQQTKDRAREIFKVVEENPRFPGCEEMTSTEERDNCSKETLMNYVAGHVKYPEAARKSGIEGMAVVRFVIEKDGSMTDLEIVRDLEGGCGEAALAVFQDMQKDGIRWIPGKQRGKDVAVIYNMPVRFKLSDNVKSEPTVNNLDLTDFKAYPNPTNDRVEIGFTAPARPVDVVLYNLDLKVIWSRNIPAFNGRFNESISLKDKTAPGVLILAVTQDGQTFSRQIVLQ
ncbi:MAG: TonB family protein [Lewinellaceae bacterium]|nr:TonB family protein [Lewinellaceae bacterium]